MGGGVGGCSAWEGKMTYLGEGFLWGTGGRGVGGNYAHKKWPKVCETRLSSSNSRTYWNQICVCLKHNFKEKLPLLQIISFGERNIEIGKCVSKVKSVTVILYLCQQISIELNHIWMTMMMMMMNCFCGMVNRRNTFSLISSRDDCQTSSPSRISNTPR